MKNIQVIDGADNCVYDIFSVPDEEFEVLFPDGQDIEFINDLVDRVPSDKLNPILREAWNRRVPKSEVNGIHGTLFYELDKKKKYYPTKRDEEAINPDGSLLRRSST